MSDKEDFDRIAGHYYASQQIRNQKRLADAAEKQAGTYRPRRFRLLWVTLIGLTIWVLIDPESAIPFIRASIITVFWVLVAIFDLIKDNIANYDWGNIFSGGG